MADKYIYNNAGTLTEKALITSSAGAGDSGKGIALDTTGKLDPSFMPVGITAPTAVILASEALAAGDLVNIYNNSGTANVRKADASTSGKEAHGFVLSGVSSGANATVYFPGAENTAVTSLTPGVQFLSAATAGKTTVTAPSGSGNTVQRVGVASSATNLIFEPEEPIVLA